MNGLVRQSARECPIWFHFCLSAAPVDVRIEPSPSGDARLRANKIIMMDDSSLLIWAREQCSFLSFFVTSSALRCAHSGRSSSGDNQPDCNGRPRRAATRANSRSLSPLLWRRAAHLFSQASGGCPSELTRPPPPLEQKRTNEADPLLCSIHYARTNSPEKAGRRRRRRRRHRR